MSDLPAEKPSREECIQAAGRSLALAILEIEQERLAA